MKLFLLAIIFSFNAFSYQGYDNKRGKDLANCIRSEFKKAKAHTGLKDFKPGQAWQCHEVHYLWNDLGELAIFSHNNGDQFSAKFQFDLKTDNNGTYLVETKYHGQRMMIDFINGSQHGMVTMTLPGSAPHINFFFNLTKNGNLVFEKHVKTWSHDNNPMTNYWPAINSHPMALYGDWPTRPATWVYKALAYGICFPEGSEPTVPACF